VISEQVNKGSTPLTLQKCMTCLLTLKLLIPGIQGFGIVDMEKKKWLFPEFSIEGAV
jgi:hypothetical protein